MFVVLFDYIHIHTSLCVTIKTHSELSAGAMF